MTSQEFNKSTLFDKLKHLTNSGIFLDSYLTRSGSLEMFKIYALQKFYVETKFSFKKQKLVEIVAFDEGIQIDKYTSNFFNLIF